MGHALSRVRRRKVSAAVKGQHDVASGQDKEHRRAGPGEQHPRCHNTRSVAASASKLSAKQSSHLSAEGLHQKGEKVTKKKKTLLPKIIITGPLDDSTSLNSLNDLPESQTIRDVADYGPYQLHMKPSTVEAYYFKQEAP
ncbi:spermatogenesis-associated protein 33 [Struthio camelus]|uniref:spermatogenesis-associated protein 33 n=1 Tax=Struthio camelus TaxID=8801 RepID=UPI003603D332